MSIFGLRFHKPVKTYMLPTKLIIIIISTLGLERFNPVPEGIHHRPHLLYSAVNLVLYIGVTDTVQGLVLEFGDLGDIVVKSLQLALDALNLHKMSLGRSMILRSGHPR